MITFESDDKGPGIFLVNEDELRFFHFGGSEVRHGRRVFVFFVLVLPVFDEVFDFLF